MAITALGTHQTVKDLMAAGFTDTQAEALAYALRQAQQIDLSQLATKSDLIELRREMAEMKTELIKWIIGIVFAQFAAILAVFKLFPGGHP